MTDKQYPYDPDLPYVVVYVATGRICSRHAEKGDALDNVTVGRRLIDTTSAPRVPEDAAYLAEIDPPTLIALLDRPDELEGREPEWEYGTSLPEALQATAEWERSWKDAEDHARGCDYGCVVVRRRILPQEVLSEWELVAEGEDD